MKKLISILLALVLATALPYSASAAKWGDANGDGRFSALDVVMVLQYISGREMALTATADVSGDAEVTAHDVSLLLRALVRPDIVVEGFDPDFDVDTDYYLCQPADFSACKVVKCNGFKSYSVEVEQYAGYLPYAATPYRSGEPLKLGHGRAIVTIHGILPDGTQKDYHFYLTDPKGGDDSMARITANTALRAAARSSSEALTTLKRNEWVYCVGTEGSWFLVEQKNTGRVGYVHKSALRRQWNETKMPAAYADAIGQLKAAHPNWSFTFVDVEMTLEQAEARYGSSPFIDPKLYLNESLIFAMLDISTYSPSDWTEAGISAIWRRTTVISKEEAVAYFSAAAESLQINPYYVTCRAALESAYGTSKFAKGTVRGYEGYYNFYGINCIDSNPTLGAGYARTRNWSTKERAVVEGANWIKAQYIDQGAVTPYFFRYAGFQNKEYMSDYTAPYQEAAILRRAYLNGSAAHFVIPVYRGVL